MGKEIRIKGELEDHAEDKTMRELKQEAGFPEDDVIIYDKGDGATIMSDKDRVRNLPEGAAVSSQPDRGKLFG